MSTASEAQSTRAFLVEGRPRTNSAGGCFARARGNHQRKIETRRLARTVADLAAPGPRRKARCIVGRFSNEVGALVTVHGLPVACPAGLEVLRLVPKASNCGIPAPGFHAKPIDDLSGTRNRPSANSRGLFVGTQKVFCCVCTLKTLRRQSGLKPQSRRQNRVRDC